MTKNSKNYKPHIVIDFDNTIAGYEGGWQGIDIIPEPPIPGALQFIIEAMEFFTVNILSTRSSSPIGMKAMQEYITFHMEVLLGGGKQPLQGEDRMACDDILTQILWPTTKPPAFLSIDDRGLCFEGDWSKFVPAELIKFKPWNKRHDEN